MRILPSLIVFMFLLSCDKLDDPPKRMLGRGMDPALHTQVIEPDLYVVEDVPRAFGHEDLSALVVARSGSRMKTLVVPTAMHLKPGDVIKTYLLCYRAEEVGVGSLEVARNACTDVVIPMKPDRR